MIKWVPRGVCAPEGFQAGGISCGIKKEGQKDLALVMCEDDICNVAAVFTTNSIVAHPVKISKERIKNGFARAVLINSGNANCCTGEEGYKAAINISKRLAKLIYDEEKHILIASTGIIGVPFPEKKILDSLAALVENTDTVGHTSAAMAIMTTDTFSKEAAVTATTPKGKITIGGMAKGAGMIFPHMATMIAVLTTDANISTALLKSALKEAVNETFNRISVDGDMSTNDSVFILANSRGVHITSKKSKEYQIFVESLKTLCMRLAEMIVRDGEGATRFVRITVQGASSQDEAVKVAEKVATSALFKCSVFGGKIVWGRIAAAVGAASKHVEEKKLEIIANKHIVFKKGKPMITRTKALLIDKDLDITIDLHHGKFSYYKFTCDFSPNYVLINKE